MGNVNMEAYQVRTSDKTMPTVQKAIDKLKNGETLIAEDIAILSEAVAGKADRVNIAGSFSAETQYFVDDLVYNEDTLYKCTTEHLGEWDSADFSATNVAAEIASGGGSDTGLKVYTETYTGTGELVNTLSFEHTPVFILSVERSDHKIVIDPFYPYAIRTKLYYSVPAIGSSDIAVTNTNGVITVQGTDVAASCNTLDETYNLVYLA